MSPNCCGCHFLERASTGLTVAKATEDLHAAPSSTRDAQSWRPVVGLVEVAALKGVTYEPGHTTQREQGPWGPCAPHWYPLLPAVPSPTPADSAELLQLVTGAVAEPGKACPILDNVCYHCLGRQPDETLQFRHLLQLHGEPSPQEISDSTGARPLPVWLCSLLEVSWPRFYNRVYTGEGILIRSHDQTARKFPALTCVCVLDTRVPFVSLLCILEPSGKWACI